MVEFGEKTQQSAYNEGMLQIQRLHFLWIEANNFSRTGQYGKWRWTLDAIWRELSRDAIRKESKQSNPAGFTEATAKNKWFIEYEKLNGKVKDSTDKKRLADVYLSLMNLEIFLRSLQDAVGKGSKYKRNDDDDIE